MLNLNALGRMVKMVMLNFLDMTQIINKNYHVAEFSIEPYYSRKKGKGVFGS